MTSLPHRSLPWVLAGLVAAAGIAIGVDRAFFAGQETRAHYMQGVLDGLVTGPNRLAPGATAYVSGPHGTWVGSAGVADVKTAEPMPVNARMRIESASKTWLVAAVLQLVQEGRLSLDDTVEQWLPGLLRAHGSEITLRQLMSDSSGLIDDNDVWTVTAAQGRAMLARVRDANLRAQLLAAFTRYKTGDRAAEFPAAWLIRLAAWQPLVAAPGTAYHHSNIGWNIAGLIAAKAAGKPLPVLYRERIFQPLGLHLTAFSPQGPIAGQHANGYSGVDGRLVDETANHPGKFADGAIVTDAQEEAAFLTALTNGTLLRRDSLREIGVGDPSGCGGPLVHSGSGAGNGYKSDAVYAADGSRVAVLLLNGRTSGTTEFTRSAAAAANLYCAG